MGFKVELDQEKCIGCGACAASCGDVFEMDGDKAKVKTPELAEVGCAEEAAKGCPVECIKVTQV